MSDRDKKDDESLEKSLGVPKIFRLFIAAVCITLFFVIYEVCITRQIIVIVHIYGVLLALLLLAYGIVNRGFSRQILDPSNLPEGMSEEEREEYITRARKRDSVSKMLLIPIIAIVLTFAFDWISTLFS